MINIFKTWIDEAYQKGYEAGMTAQKLTDKSDQNRRLEDMLKHGKAIGKNEGMQEGYRIGYKCGYEEGKADALAEVGEITIDDVNDILEATEDEMRTI